MQKVIVALRSVYEKLSQAAERFKRAGNGLILLSIVTALLLPADYGKLSKYVAALVFVLFIFFYVAFSKPKHALKPANAAGHFIHFPCSGSDLQKAITIARYYFGADTMNPAFVWEAYNRNPFGFVVVKDRDGEVLGYADMYGLADATLNTLLRRENSEDRLSRDDLVGGIIDIQRSRKLYIGGIAVNRNRAKMDYEVGRITGELIYGMAHVLNREFMTDGEPWELHAVGYSPEGLAIMVDHFNFLPRDASDSEGAYSISVTRPLLMRYLRNKAATRHSVQRDRLRITYETVVPRSTAA